MRARHGMTLLELMIGIVVMGAAVAAGYGTFASIVDQRQRTRGAVNEVARGAAVRRTITNWIEASHIIIQTDESVPRGGPDFRMQNMRDELDLFTFAPTPTGSGATRITILVNNFDRRYQSGLVALLTPIQAGMADTSVLVLDSTVTGLRVEYFVNLTGTPDWYTKSELSGVPTRPSAVRLHCISDNMERLTPLLQLPITVRIPEAAL